MDYLKLPDDSHRMHVWKKSLKRYYNDTSAKKRSLFLILIIIFTLFIISSSSSSSDLSIKNKDSKINDDIYKLLNPEIGNNNYLTYFDDIKKFNKIPNNSSLRAKLSFYFPYDKESDIPKNIFQTWRVDSNDEKFPKNFKPMFESWSRLNKNWTHFLLKDSEIDEWIKNEFFNIPEILQVWNLLPKFILKADFLRYLIIFSRGGIYSDMDTICLKSIDEWLIDINNYGLTIGIEADPDRKDWFDWYARRIQFIQWTIVGKRGHPLLREIIIRIVNETLRKQKMGVLNKIEGKDNGGDIMQWTGPGIFTDTVFDYINNVYSNGNYGDGFGIGSNNWLKLKKFKLKKPDINENGLPNNDDKMFYNWSKFTGLKEPVSINENDVLILPITSFSPGVGQMGSKSVQDKLAFVKHNFEGSWKPEDERMK